MDNVVRRFVDQQLKTATSELEQSAQALAASAQLFAENETERLRARAKRAERLLRNQGGGA